jgi:RNA polymerase sigma-70 factor (ECF subfamily)
MMETVNEDADSRGASPPTPEEERTEVLLAGARRGEPRALEELIEAHLDDLRAFVRLQLDPRLRVRESHSDVVQSICREVLEDLPGFEYRGEGSFRAWLFTAALNKVRQKGEFHHAQMRDVAREVRAEKSDDEEASVGAGLYASLCSLEPSPSQHAIAHEQAARIERAMDKLPPDHRNVLLLARIVGLSHREIATRVGRSEMAVRTLVSDASVRLLAALEERG